MNKVIHVSAFLLEKNLVESFLACVAAWNEPEGTELRDVVQTVEVLDQEDAHHGFVGLDLWFAGPSIGFYFGAFWERWQQEEGGQANG